MQYSVRNRRRLRTTSEHSAVAVPRTTTLPVGFAAPEPMLTTESAPVPRGRFASGTGPHTAHAGGAMPASPDPVLLPTRDSDQRILSSAEQAALAIPRTATARGTGMSATAPAHSISSSATKRPTKPLDGPVKEIVKATANKDGWKR